MRPAAMLAREVLHLLVPAPIVPIGSANAIPASTWPTTSTGTITTHDEPCATRHSTLTRLTRIYLVARVARQGTTREM